MRSGDPGPGPDGRLSPLEFARGEIGATLRRLRLRKGLSGKALGETVGMSQAKISKIETGSAPVSPPEITLLAETLEAPGDLVAELTARAEALQGDEVRWRELRSRLADAQQSFAEAESLATVVRDFSPAVVPGLLQTAEYGRAILTGVSVAVKGPETAEEMDVGNAVRVRMERQQILYDQAKTFLLVTSEAAFSYPPCSPTGMLAQLGHLRAVATLSNVHLRVLTIGTQLEIPFTNGVTMLDGDRVVVDLLNTGVQTRESGEIRTWRRAFDHYWDRSTGDLDPILRRYESLYARQAEATRQ